MVLDFNGALFRNQGLQQDTGLLKGRWGQDGSTRFDATGSYANADGTLRTVTTGKVAYVQSISYQSDTADDGRIYDGGSGGTLKVYLEATVVNTVYTLFFDPPLAFTTSIVHDYSNGVYGNGTWKYTISGWEEDAP